VGKQDRAEFERMLKEVLAFDVDSAPPYRLANILAQRRARALLDHVDDLFA
jgi:predicted anti-sigma-YlaC factor YlaD